MSQTIDSTITGRVGSRRVRECERGTVRPTSLHRGRTTCPQAEPTLPKRNYGYEKRQKELNKQRKQEEKRQRKLERAEAPAAADAGTPNETPLSGEPGTLGGEEG
jgi:hypothetical protein